MICVLDLLEFVGIGIVDPRLLVMFSGGDTKDIDNSVSVVKPLPMESILCLGL